MAEKVTMGKDNIKRLQKDIIDIIKNPLTDNGIYYSHDDTNKSSCSIVDDSTGVVRRFQYIILEPPKNKKLESVYRYYRS